jgi:hypothetical protein
MSTFISEPGTRLGGRYRLEDRIAGASGWLAWKAIDETLARPVSVLTFADGFPRVREVLTAARAASRLTDARLAQVFDVEDAWDNAYIVLEWASGETLADLLAAGPIEPVAGARIIAETAAALSAAHAAGLAHLCLTPDSLRWTAGGGVKVAGIGTDAALFGTTAEDPAAADTRGLGRLLYAALTGLWPGPDYPALQTAPYADGHPRRPRQVRAGVPAGLDEVTCRAMQLSGPDGALTTPGQLARALFAELPPEEIPPAGPQTQGRRLPPRPPEERDYWAAETAPPGRTSQDWSEPRQLREPRGGADRGTGSRGRGRAAVIAVLAVALVAGGVFAAVDLLHKGGPGPAAAIHRITPTGPAVLQPASAAGFDALNLADQGDENTSQAPNVLDGNPQGWSTQQYASAALGNLKAGTGLILDMGRPVRLSSITVTFGPQAGADVEIKVGTSAMRSAANLDSMQTVASAADVSGGAHTFTVSRAAAGQYIVIWFTRLPPIGGGQFMAQVLSVVVRGTAASG